MSRPLWIVGGVLGTLTIVALVILSRGPSIVVRPQNAAPTNATPLIVAAGTPMPTRSTLPVYDLTLPEFQGITMWWNTPDGKPLTPALLKGKVVLVDFWTYSCINCIRTYPFLKSLYAKYADKGLVIVGVHTPEFAFEKDPKNVGAEIIKNGILWPVALDPDYATWNAYSNHSWPAEYFFDRQGRLRRTHFGEGEYDESELAIRSLLQENGVELSSMGETVVSQPDFSKIQTLETYFGLDRGDAFMGTTGSIGADANYAMPETIRDNMWAADGTWRFFPEYVQTVSANARWSMSVQASKLHLVMASDDGKDKHLEIYVDGVKISEMTVNASALYDIAAFSDAARHTVEVRCSEPGVRFYTATFS